MKMLWWKPTFLSGSYVHIQERYKSWSLREQTETLCLCSPDFNQAFSLSYALFRTAYALFMHWFFSLRVCPSIRFLFIVFTCHLCSKHIQFQFSQSNVNWASWYVPITPALRRRRWKDQKSKIILSYRVNSRPVWDTWDPVLK